LDSVEGSLGAILIGMDGVPVECVNRAAALDLPLLSAEIAPFLRNAQEVSSRLNWGRVDGLSIYMEQVNLAFWSIGGEYYLGLATVPTGPFGKARSKIGGFLPEIKAEL